MSAPFIWCHKIYTTEGLDDIVCKHFGIKSKSPDLSAWEKFTQTLACPDGEVTIGIVGKYAELQDAYKSLNESLIHAGVANSTRVVMKWINAEEITPDTVHTALAGVHAILVPGGFGKRGTEGMIFASKFAREHHIPVSWDLLGYADGRH